MGICMSSRTDHTDVPVEIQPPPPPPPLQLNEDVIKSAIRDALNRKRVEMYSEGYCPLVFTAEWGNVANRNEELWPGIILANRVIATGEPCVVVRVNMYVGQQLPLQTAFRRLVCVVSSKHSDRITWGMSFAVAEANTVESLVALVDKWADCCEVLLTYSKLPRPGLA